MLALTESSVEDYINKHYGSTPKGELNFDDIFNELLRRPLPHSDTTVDTRDLKRYEFLPTINLLKKQVNYFVHSTPGGIYDHEDEFLAYILAAFNAYIVLNQRTFRLHHGIFDKCYYNLKDYAYKIKVPPQFLVYFREISRPISFNLDMFISYVKIDNPASDNPIEALNIPTSPFHFMLPHSVQNTFVSIQEDESKPYLVWETRKVHDMNIHLKSFIRFVDFDTAKLSSDIDDSDFCDLRMNSQLGYEASGFSFSPDGKISVSDNYVIGDNPRYSLHDRLDNYKKYLSNYPKKLKNAK